MRYATSRKAWTQRSKHKDRSDVYSCVACVALDALQAYPSLKPLGSWVTDLVARMQFMMDWIEHGIPSVSTICCSRCPDITSPRTKTPSSDSVR